MDRADQEEWDRLGESSDDDGTVKLDKTTEDLECMICGKRFKSLKQLQNHERSKKHIENLAALKGAFRNDDEQVERLGKQLGIDISFKKTQKAADIVGGEVQEEAADDQDVEGLDVSSVEPSTSEPEVKGAVEGSTLFDEDFNSSIIGDESGHVAKVLKHSKPSNRRKKIKKVKVPRQTPFLVCQIFTLVFLEFLCSVKIWKTFQAKQFSAVPDLNIERVMSFFRF